MSNEREDLAQRAVACSRWRWMPGMLAIRWTGPCRGSHRYTDADVRAGVTFYRGTPDLTDPATLGCLLALVREARGDQTYLPTLLPLVSGARWAVEHTMTQTATLHESEAAVLVAALEAAS